MASELQIGGITTGWTVYAILRTSLGTVWNGSSFETFNAANWATYDIALTEQGPAGYYVGDMPGVAAGLYSVEVRRQTGGSPAAAVATDPYLGGGDVDWDGTVLRGAGTARLADAVTHGGTTAKLRLGGSSGDPPLYVSASGSSQHAVRFAALGTGTAGLKVEGASFGMWADGGATGTGAAFSGAIGVTMNGNTNEGLYVSGGTVGAWIEAGDSSGIGMKIDAVGSGGVAVYLNGSDRPLTAPNGTGGGALIDINGTVSFLGVGAIANAAFSVETGLRSIRSTTAQAGTASTITLDASASAVDDFYTGTIVYLMAGTGLRQARLITAYNGTTKVATVSPDWKTNPASGTTFTILPAGAVTPAEFAAAWGSRVLGNGRTADYYLMGGMNRTTRSTSAFTIYSYDDATVLAACALTQDGDLDPIESIDPA